MGMPRPEGRWGEREQNKKRERERGGKRRLQPHVGWLSVNTSKAQNPDLMKGSPQLYEAYRCVDSRELGCIQVGPLGCNEQFDPTGKIINSTMGHSYDLGMNLHQIRDKPVWLKDSRGSRHLK